MKLRAKLGSAEKHPNKVNGSGVASGDFALPQAYVHHQMLVITHHGIGIDPAGNDVAQLQNSAFNPRVELLEVPGVGHAPMFMDDQQVAPVRDLSRVGN